MLNIKPIFIVGFARGGSNILLNLFRSHPEVCSPRGELQEVFKGKGAEPWSVKISKLIDYLPILVREKKDIFNIDFWQPRNPLSRSSQKRIDRILFNDKQKATDISQNFYKSENQKYSKEEIRSSRLLCKNLNGLIFLTSELQRMYPDAVFIALVRNGFAVIEGHVRRGYDLRAFANHYERSCLQMIEDNRRYSNYHIFRYEDFIENPLESLRSLYQVSELDLKQVSKIRLQTKRVVNADGTHNLTRQGVEKQLHWYQVDDFFKHFVTDANENQISRLNETQKEDIKEICLTSLKHFDYL